MSVDRRQAALNPEAADRYNADRIATRLLTDPVAEMAEADMNRARTAFMGVADEIRDEYADESAKRTIQGERIWRAL